MYVNIYIRSIYIFQTERLWFKLFRHPKRRRLALHPGSPNPRPFPPSVVSQQQNIATKRKEQRIFLIVRFDCRWIERKCLRTHSSRGFYQFYTASGMFLALFIYFFNSNSATLQSSDFFPRFFFLGIIGASLCRFGIKKVSVSSCLYRWYRSYSCY